MKTSDKGLDIIKKHEGLRLNSYLDAVKIWTIGYGHTRGVKQHEIITIEQAEQFLRDDVANAERTVNRLNIPLNQNQFDALVSLIFNIGEGNFFKSTLRRKLMHDTNDPTIASEFKRWVYAGGKRLTGLINRRNEEANLYFSVTP